MGYPLVYCKEILPARPSTGSGDRVRVPQTKSEYNKQIYQGPNKGGREISYAMARLGCDVN